MNSNRNPIRAALALVAATCACGAGASAQDGNQNITVTVRPSRSVDQRIADETRAKELRRIAEEKLAAAESARAADSAPKALLRRARTVYVESDTSFFEPAQLQNELRKRDEFDAWGMAILDGSWDRRNVADIVVEVDRPLFTYTYTYKITARDTGVLLAAGKLNAFDGNAAAPKIAGRIIDEIRKARGETKAKK
ncbi:MAG TPA: hypothetical protein VM936_02230 [Pyrinomonadaceae bacterium]|jgi:hypothetical protein|nr:hypothetical protein [Pyrinomonadaceae bacterium]